MKPGRVAVLWEQWYYFNERFFGGKLTPPDAIRITSARAYHGKIIYKGTAVCTSFHLKHRARICISTHLSHYEQTGTLLHEMVHQYQLQVMETEPDHGKVFVSYCRWIERQTGFKPRSTALE